MLRAYRTLRDRISALPASIAATGAVEAVRAEKWFVLTQDGAPMSLLCARLSSSSKYNAGRASFHQRE